MICIMVNKSIRSDSYGKLARLPLRHNGGYTVRQWSERRGCGPEGCGTVPPVPGGEQDEGQVTLVDFRSHRPVGKYDPEGKIVSCPV